MSDTGAYFHASASYNSVVEFPVSKFSILFIGTLRTVGRIPGGGVTIEFFFTYQKSDLRAEVQDESGSVTLVFSEGKMGQQRNFYVVHGPVVGVVTAILYNLFPSSLGEVDFALDTTNHLEIFFGDIADGESEFRSNEVGLLDAGSKADRVQVDSSVDSHRKIMPFVL